MKSLALVFVLAACSNASDPPAVDAPKPPTDAPVDAPSPDAAVTALNIIVINEVAAGEAPDWVEVVNNTNAAVELSDYVYVDAEADFVKARAFPAMQLAAGAYYVQDVSQATSGFALGSDEHLFVYRASDMRLSDSVDWAEGAAATGMSYRRIPDKTGTFATGAQTKGAANQ